MRRYFVSYAAGNGWLGSLELGYGEINSYKDVIELSNFIQKEMNINGVTIINWIEFK